MADLPSVVHPFGAGTLLQLIREGTVPPGPTSRRSRASRDRRMGQRLEQLRRPGCCASSAKATRPGGRPPMMLAFNDAGRRAGRRSGRNAFAPGGHQPRRHRCSPRTSRTCRSPAARRPSSTGSDERFHALLREVGRDDDVVRGIGIGVPGPVEHATGSPNPPIMPGWDGYPIPERFADRYRVPVLVDNDVNIMALGALDELGRRRPPALHQGRDRDRLRDRRRRAHPPGRRGAAGDIGHIRVAAGDEADAIVCGCGNVGCLEALAGGGAMAARLTTRASTRSTRGRSSSWRGGEPAAVRLVRESGR